MNEQQTLTPIPSNPADPRHGWTSASNAFADKLCPGRHVAQRGIPEPQDKGEDATGGTLMHAALAVMGDQTGPQLTLEQQETVDACRSIEAKIVQGYFGAKETPKVFRHRRFWLRVNKADRTELKHSGEADVCYRAGTKLLIADYKTLAGDVPESSKNLQLRDLAVMAAGELMPITEVATVIIQPLVTHSPEVCIYTKDDLGKALHEMCLRVVLSNDPKAKRVPGEEQCKYCLAATSCVERQKWAGAIAHPALLQLLDVPITQWSPPQRAQAARALGPCFDLLEDIKKALKEGLDKDPNFVPGFKLQPGAKREVINNPQECFTRFTNKGGTLEQFMTCIVVGKTKLKEQLATVTGEKGMALDKQVKALVEGITETHQNAPSLKEVDK